MNPTDSFFMLINSQKFNHNRILFEMRNLIYTDVGSARYDVGNIIVGIRESIGDSL